MVGTLTLCGRDEQVRALDHLLEELDARGSAVVVRGEAGIGKSSLLEAATRSARARGMSVLTTTGGIDEVGPGVVVESRPLSGPNSTPSG